MAWRLNTALTNFRAAVDRAYPNRDRTSDGTIGDAAHQASVSDHNPDPDGTVDAWDMDVNLRSGDDRGTGSTTARSPTARPAGGASGTPAPTRTTSTSTGTRTR
jgi:hypothetical protein